MNQFNIGIPVNTGELIHPTKQLKGYTKTSPIELVQLTPKKTTRKRKYRKSVSIITGCEHTNAQFYSKGLCKNCYHKRGRVKLATGCKHLDRRLYARLVCKGCYLRIFHRGGKRKPSDPEPQNNQVE